MWSDAEIEDVDANTAYCEVCGERDVLDALVPVLVATREWHRTERLLHPECRELFLRDNLEAVLASIRLQAVQP